MVKKRLDRVLCNSEWCITYPTTDCIALPAIGSDHTPIIISTSSPKKRKGRIFKYEAFWSEEKECVHLVRDTWEEYALQQLNVVEKLIPYAPFAIWKLKPPNTSYSSTHGQAKYGEPHQDVRPCCCSAVEYLEGPEPVSFRPPPLEPEAHINPGECSV